MNTQAIQAAIELAEVKQANVRHGNLPVAEGAFYVAQAQLALVKAQAERLELFDKAMAEARRWVEMAEADIRHLQDKTGPTTMIDLYQEIAAFGLPLLETLAALARNIP